MNEHHSASHFPSVCSTRSGERPIPLTSKINVWPRARYRQGTQHLFMRSNDNDFMDAEATVEDRHAHMSSDQER